MLIKSKGANFALLCIIILGNWSDGNFFPKSSDFPGKRQKLEFFCFYRVTKTIQGKIAPQIQVSGGRVVKTSDHSPAPTSNRPITGSSPNSA